MISKPEEHSNIDGISGSTVVSSGVASVGISEVGSKVGYVARGVGRVVEGLCVG